MEIIQNMDKTDSKIRLLFELTFQKDVQIVSYIPLKDYSKEGSWCPEKMYSHPHKQNYYVFINDPDLIKVIKSKEPEGQKQLFKLSDQLEKPNNLLIEFNANSIENEMKKTDEDQYIIFARITVDNFSFINDYSTVTKAQLMDRNRPLIYANQGRIKEYLLGEKVDKEKNDEANDNNPNSTKNSIKDDDKRKSGEENDIENENKKKKEDLKKKADYIPGHWFLVNMNNIYYEKKNVYDKNKKNKIIKFLSVIKYREITTNEQDPQDPNNPNPESQNNLTKSIINSQMTQNQNNINPINIDVDMRFQQEREFCFRANENSKLITIYQPKSCKIHNKKNDFWCKNCNKFCCLECFVSENGTNEHKNHKIHLLDEITNKLDEDSFALEERFKNLLKIIDSEILLKRNELQKLKNENKVNVEKIKKLYEEKNSNIKQEEIKRAKTLAALVNEILRIRNEYTRRINYLRFLFDKGSMNNYLTNYYIFKKVFETETKKNLMVLVRKVTDIYNYYTSKKTNINN